MSELADALVRQVNELKASAEKAERERDNLERAMIDQVCPSCEGPLTCAKCVTEPDETGTHEDRIADLEREVADHEARIKELEARLPRCPLCESSDGGHQNGCRWKR